MEDPITVAYIGYRVYKWLKGKGDDGGDDGGDASDIVDTLL